jgi:hypothetical protein
MKVSIAFLTALLCLAAVAADLEKGDAYIRRHADTWVIGSSLVEKTVQLSGGNLTLASFRNKISGREYIQAGVASREIRFLADGESISGVDGKWNLVRDETQQLSQGELQLDLVLRHGDLEVTKHYVVYPAAALIREWIEIRNASSRAIRIREPYFLESHVLGAEADALELHYVTGGGNYNGSQLLKTERVDRSYKRTFDSAIGIQTQSYSAYLPLLVLRNPRHSDGIMAGWDYMGHWALMAGNYDGAPVNLAIKVAGYEKDLQPGQRIETPKAFTGVFKGGIDEIGNLLLDWQYRYMWEFTSPNYFAKTRWAVDWPNPWVGPGGTPSGDNWGRRLALDLRYVDLMRETGTDILWDDAGWYDKWGSWNAPEWRLTTDFLAKHGMRWVLWYPTFLATTDSIVGQEHPEWLIPGRQTLEQSIPATVDWQKALLDRGVKDWGEFQWRYDIAPAVSANDTDYLQSDQNFRALLLGFKQSHPESGIDACYGGGRWISYDIARFAESGEYTDGGVGPYSSYWSSLIVSPDKLHNVVDFDHTLYNPGSDRTHLGMGPTWYRDPGDGPDTEAIRKDWDIYRYMVAQGVAGKWSHVFRPAVENDDPVWYFQRSDRQGLKSIIIAKHAKTGPAYYVISKPLDSRRDSYFGAQWNMSVVTTSGAARLDTGIYEDPIDHRYAYYGSPGECYGPLNFKYQTATGEQPFVTAISKLGARKAAGKDFIGMAIQIGNEPLTITHLGQYDPSHNRGKYRLTVVRAADGAEMASAELDMGQGYADVNKFKYVRLPNPVRLDPAPGQGVVIRPKGLKPDAEYDVRFAKSPLRARRSGADLMAQGISLATVEPGELVYLNLPNHPGSGEDKTAPQPPSKVTKRRGSNLGVQGIEVAWSPGKDNNWISYYEVLRDGQVIGRSAIGAFFFDYKGSGLERLGSRYEVRTVDGDGNRSPLAAARQTAGDPESYRALGCFSAMQGANQWRYEESVEGTGFRELNWDKDGYEGRWMGSGLAKIGRIWMQPGAKSDVARTFVAPAKGVVSISGEIRKDPSAMNGRAAAARILHNDRQIWPASGWAEIAPEYAKSLPYRIENVPVAAGDRVRFVLKHNGINAPDPVVWDPMVVVVR